MSRQQIARERKSDQTTQKTRATFPTKEACKLDSLCGGKASRQRNAQPVIRMTRRRFFVGNSLTVSSSSMFIKMLCEVFLFRMKCGLQPQCPGLRAHRCALTDFLCTARQAQELVSKRSKLRWYHKTRDLLDVHDKTGSGMRRHLTNWGQKITQ